MRPCAICGCVKPFDLGDTAIGITTSHGPAFAFVDPMVHGTRLRETSYPSQLARHLSEAVKQIENRILLFAMPLHIRAECSIEIAIVLDHCRMEKNSDSQFHVVPSPISPRQRTRRPGHVNQFFCLQNVYGRISGIRGVDHRAAGVLKDIPVIVRRQRFVVRLQTPQVIFLHDDLFLALRAEQTPRATCCARSARKVTLPSACTFKADLPGVPGRRAAESG